MRRDVAGRNARQDAAIARMEALFDRFFTAVAKKAVKEFNRTAVKAAGGDPVGPVDERLLFDDRAWFDLMDDVEPLLVQVATEEAAAVGLSWDVGHLNVTSIVQQHVDAVAGLETVVKGHLNDVLSEALAEGWSVQDAAKALRDTGSMSDGSAIRWARTEIISASNSAAEKSYREVAEPGDELEWLSTSDDRTRPSHSAANGQRIPADGSRKFNVGGYDCDHPGDQSLPKNERILCRCSVVFVPAPLTASGDDYTPTAAMSREAARGLEWNEQGLFSALDSEVALATRIAGAEKLSSNDLDKIISVWNSHGAHGINAVGWRYGDEGYPSTQRCRAALAGGEDGVRWARRKKKKRKFYGLEADSMSEETEVTDAVVQQAIDEIVADIDANIDVADMAVADEPVMITNLDGTETADQTAAEVAFATAPPDTALTIDNSVLNSPVTGIGDQGLLDAIAAGNNNTFNITYGTSASGLVAGPGQGLLGDPTPEPITASGGPQKLTFAIRNLKPGMTAAGPFRDSHAPEDGDTKPYDWEMLAVVEGIETGDKRRIDVGGLVWRDLPLSLMVQRVTSEGHDGSEFAGSIKELLRDGNQIWGRGYWANNEVGTETAQLVEDEVVKGVSVDLDSTEVEIMLTEPDEDGWQELELIIIKEARISGATIVSIPAFAEAQIYLVTDEDQPDRQRALFPGLVSDGGPSAQVFTPYLEDMNEMTALVAAGAPGAERVGRRSLLSADVRDSLYMPDPAFFEGPPEGTLSLPIPFTVDRDNGRVFGHIARWGAWHTSFNGRKVTVPRSECDYAAFYGRIPELDGERVGPKVVCSDGSEVQVGRIFVNCDHMADDYATIGETIDHYANTGALACLVRVYETNHGVYVTGQLHPEISDAQLFTLTATPLSGDWRPRNGNLELLAIQAVNLEGFNNGVIVASGAPRPGQFRALVASGGEPVLLQGGMDPSKPVVSTSVLDRLSLIESTLGIQLAPANEQEATELAEQTDEEWEAALTELGIEVKDDFADALAALGLATDTPVSADEVEVDADAPISDEGT